MVWVGHTGMIIVPFSVLGRFFFYVKEPLKEQSWLSWLVRGFQSERSPVRSSVTSTSASISSGPCSYSFEFPIKRSTDSGRGG